MADSAPAGRPAGEAIALVLLANLLFAFVDTSTKWLIGAGLAVIQLAFLRYAVHFAITLALGAAMPRGRPGLSWRLWGLTVLRSFCLVSATIANFVALGQLPLVVTSAILFLSPVLVSLFARPILGERLTRWQIAALALGFAGVLIIANPFGAEINWYALLMLYPASGLALYIVLTRLLSGHVRAATMQFTTGALGTLGLAPLGLAAWVVPEGALSWALAMGLGLFAWAGHECLTRAHVHTSASALAPYGYSLVIYLALAGWIVFGDAPSARVLAGAACVIAAGFLARRTA